jgi:uncharacterized protein
MLPRLLAFTDALRRAGVPVAISDQTDGLRALAHIPMVDKEAFRASLQATMIKTRAHQGVFDLLFDLYFGTGRGPEAIAEGDAELGDEMDVDEFMRRLTDALMEGDDDEIQRLARLAVASFGRVETERSGSPYFEYRVYRALDLDELLTRLLQGSGGEEGLSELEERLMRDEFQARLDRFRGQVTNEVRRRLAEHRGAEQVAKAITPPLPEDIDFVRATRDEIRELKRAVTPLARRLATRLAIKRRHARRGRLDVRRTVRASLSTGGVPFDTRFKHRSKTRPELYLVCDISGSVSAFARFTLMFVHAFQAQFSKVRSFVFVDALDEVTDTLKAEDFLEAVDRLAETADVVRFDGHSDYGHSLEEFYERVGRELSPRASVLILGDARSNYRDPSSWVVRELSARARRVYWLNPEPKRFWGTGDSVADEYARYCDQMIEVRNLRQLQSFIEKVI